MCVEAQHPVADDLKRHTTNLCRLAARSAIIDCRQSEKPVDSGAKRNGVMKSGFGRLCRVL
jgi:hypothetical protein